MKILYISPRYEGGIGGHAKRVAEKLQENGFDIELMYVPHLPIKKLKNLSFSFFGTLKAIMNNTEYDVVHAWNVPSAFVMKYVKAKKKVLSIHGIYSEQVQMIHSSHVSFIAKVAEKKAIEIADVYTTDSKIVCDSYKKKFNKNFIYLPAPLDSKKFNTIPEITKKNNQIIYIGRDSYEKGIDILKKIESKIKSKVIYCTNLPWEDTMKNLKESQILVVPSRIESIPQVIKEAFYLKIPVISTDVGGVSEIIQDHKSGILVPPNNPDKLLESINHLIENKKLAETLGKSGHDFITENFSWEFLLPKYISFYKNLI